MNGEMNISINGLIITGNHRPTLPNIKSSFEKIEILFNKYKKML